MLNDVLRLNVIGGFTREGLKRLVEDNDEIASAWRRTESVTKSNWAKRLASEAGASDQTVYERRKKWLQDCRIDISIPHRYYVDLLSLGSLSVAESEGRAEVIAAIFCDDAKQVLPLLKTMLQDFDQQRSGVVGRTVVAPLAKVDVLPIENSTTMATKIRRSRKALSPPAKELRQARDAKTPGGGLGHGKKIARQGNSRPGRPPAKAGSASKMGNGKRRGAAR